MILVTGATGHIGNVLVRELVARGERVRALVLPKEDRSSLDGLDVEVMEGNVLDPASLERAFAGVSDVFHLAGIISIMPGENEQVQRVNVEGTRNILQAATNAGVHRLVYTSSIHAFFRAPHGVTIDESIPFDPNNHVGAYDRSKALATLVVQEAVRQGLDAVIVCPTGVIGPYDYLGSEMGNIIKGAVEHRPQLYIDGAYDFVDVRDVAQGMLLAYDKGRTGEVYILSGEQIEIEQLINLVQEVSGNHTTRIKFPQWLARFVTIFSPTYYRLTRVKPRFTPYSLETLRSNSVISNKKAKRELGYSPRSIRESVVETVKWLTNQKQALSDGIE
ncbi:MAG: SDR family oxidoreductase [Chloroflexota bacterium]|nr:SDR family oxidoreductase [Chloroflexota bacterium]